jgi:cell division protein FtsQ
LTQPGSRNEAALGEVRRVAAEGRSRIPGASERSVTGGFTERGLDAWLPSVRSLLVGVAALLLAVGLYAVARGTSMFAIERVEVHGVPPGFAARVRAALEPLTGSSLVAFDATDGNRRLASVPIVAAASYDRDFPHTLVVSIVAERPIALLRRGPVAWVVSDSGRVLRKATARPLPDLPRIWVPATADPLVGAVVADDSALAVGALSTMSGVHLPIPIRSVRLVDGEISLTLTSGTDILMGGRSQLAVKAAVAARIVEVAATARTIDVSVPERVITSEVAPD